MKYDLTAPGDPSLAPGDARCPGPTTRDIILQDGDGAPAALTAESYSFLGDTDIEFKRYTSPTLYQQEIDNMWSRTWQWACREEHIPNPGDFSVYDVGPYSAIVIRDNAGDIRAYVNSCPHRGMQFCDAGSIGSGKQFLRCPFHGMSWHLDGSLREIPCRWDFPHIEDANFGLIALPCDTWCGFVFINFDQQAGPLSEYLEVLPEHFANWPLQDRYVSLHMEKILPGNIGARQQHAQLQRERLSAELHTDMSHVSNSEMLDSIEYFLFPNACFFPGIGIPLIYRFRPLDVDHCVHEILMLKPVPANSSRPPPAQVVKLGIDDSYSTVADFAATGLAYVLDQDTENFKRQRAGMKAAIKPGQTLGNYQEVRIRRLHMTLDNYMNKTA